MSTQLKNFLACSAFAFFLATGVGCATRVVVPVTPPPAAAVEVRPESPGEGYVWVDGYYDYTGGTYVWVAGRWTLPPFRGAVWVGHRWYSSGGRWHFARGYWRR